MADSTPPLPPRAPIHESWTLAKPAVEGAGGVVVSQHHAASAIGARVLAEGGNAVDAAVTAGLAIGTLEPWMSGLGGGGFMLVRLAASGQCWCVEFGMRAPRRLDPADYPLAGGADADLFGWPAVLEERNCIGPLAFTVPGLVAGHAAALERFGTRSWAEALAPAIEQARAGLLADWYATLKIAAEARTLARFADSARVFLPDGLPPAGTWGGPLPVIELRGLAATLERLAAAGPRDFYEGEVAAAIAADCERLGARLEAADLAAYRASIRPAAATRYRDATVHAAPGLTAGPTLMRALAALERALEPAPGRRPGEAAYRAYAQVLGEAYAERLATLGDESGPPGEQPCTTHLSVVDRDGNLVALTQTLLSVFGSRVVLPATGILMNNGVMWFDPRPGRPNSIRAGRRPLANMCPTVLERGDGLRVALGASGGRRILPAVLQLSSFLVDFAMDLEAAAHCPRIDASGAPPLIADARLAPEVQAALAAEHDVLVAPNAVYPALFACPNLAAHDPARGVGLGAAYVQSPWAAARAAPR